MPTKKSMVRKRKSPAYRRKSKAQRKSATKYKRRSTKRRSTKRRSTKRRSTKRKTSRRRVSMAFNKAWLNKNLDRVGGTLDTLKEKITSAETKEFLAKKTSKLESGLKGLKGRGGGLSRMIKSFI